jgi:hypothetical protein
MLWREPELAQRETKYPNPASLSGLPKGVLNHYRHGRNVHYCVSASRNPVRQRLETHQDDIKIPKVFHLALKSQCDRRGNRGCVQSSAGRSPDFANLFLRWVLRLRRRIRLRFRLRLRLGLRLFVFAIQGLLLDFSLAHLLTGFLPVFHELLL